MGFREVFDHGTTINPTWGATFGTPRKEFKHRLSGFWGWVWGLGLLGFGD